LGNGQDNLQQNIFFKCAMHLTKEGSRNGNLMSVLLEKGVRQSPIPSSVCSDSQRWQLCTGVAETWTWLLLLYQAIPPRCLGLWGLSPGQPTRE
jgi:hypothetical protein